MVQIPNLAKLGNRTALKLEKEIVAKIVDVLFYLLQVREIKTGDVQKTVHKIVFLGVGGIHDVQPLTEISLDNRAIA